MSKYTPVIGLEIHVELKTKSKMFCQCDADYFGKKPNTNTCPVCIGMPGALPVPNRTAVEWVIKIGHALNCIINKHSKFDRKHYFYPDLPKAYQISQYDEPLAEHGYFEIQNPKTETSKKIGITRVHLEEDTGKLTHTGSDTLVDFNRSSVPLVEIVTEPDFDNAEDVKIFLEELHTIIRYLDVSDANMEEGSMRMEPNISLMLVHPPSSGHPLPEGGHTKDLPFEGSTLKGGGMSRNLPNYKVEVKNINSFNFAKKAIDFELIRQAEILNKGETPSQETRGYDDKKGITFSQRSKEEAQDYRYFPEPDIPPMVFTDEEIENIRKTLPELPHDKVTRYVKEFDLKFEDAFILTRSIELAHYYEEVLGKLRKNSSQLALNRSLEQVTASDIVNKKIVTTIDSNDFVETFIKLHKMVEVDEMKLTEVIKSIIKNNPIQVEQYKKGKTGLLGYFIGQVMKEMKGQADPQMIQIILKTKLQ